MLGVGGRLGDLRVKAQLECWVRVCVWRGAEDARGVVGAANAVGGAVLWHCPRLNKLVAVSAASEVLL